jgi:hypothetical protein
LFRAMKELRTSQEKREGKKPKSGQPKSERNMRAESGSENLPNEAIALDAPVQGSEFDVSSSSELPNEPIVSSEPSQIPDSRSQMGEELPNEATVEPGNEEPPMKR